MQQGVNTSAEMLVRGRERNKSTFHTNSCAHMLNILATRTLLDELRTRREIPPPEVRRQLRKKAGVSIEAVAREVGVCRQAVGHWEAGSRFPRGENLDAYARVLRILRDEVAA